MNRISIAKRAGIRKWITQRISNLQKLNSNDFDILVARKIARRANTTEITSILLLFSEFAAFVFMGIEGGISTVLRFRFRHRIRTEVAVAESHREESLCHSGEGCGTHGQRSRIGIRLTDLAATKYPFDYR